MDAGRRPLVARFAVLGELCSEALLHLMLVVGPDIELLLSRLAGTRRWLRSIATERGKAAKLL